MFYARPRGSRDRDAHFWQAVRTTSATVAKAMAPVAQASHLVELATRSDWRAASLAASAHSREAMVAFAWRMVSAVWASP